MGWMTGYRKWTKTQIHVKLVNDNEAKAQKSQSAQPLRSQRRNPFNICQKSHSKQNYSQYLLLRSDTTESWDSQPSEIPMDPESPLIVQYGNEDSFLHEHLSFLILQTQPRAVATLYNNGSW